MAQKKIKTESNPSEENKSVDNKKVVKTASSTSKPASQPVTEQRAEKSWARRNRTSAWRDQNPLPYRLATAHQQAPYQRDHCPTHQPA